VTTPIRRSPIHHGQVLAGRDLTPRMRRVTVRSEAMLGVELRPAQDVELHLVDGAGRRVKRRYTIRAARPETGELDLDVLLHGDWPGSQWGRTAAPGDPVSFQGPRGKLELRPAAWHLIGHLQTNKVKDAIELFDVIHSLDRLELAHELERRAAARGQVVETLLQVNVAAEASKGGVAPDAVGETLDVIGKLAHVHVSGLMTIPPEVERPEEARPWFRRLRELAERHGLRQLSMGMSGDFEVAVEEGATMVRVGTAIFGPRA